MRVTYLILLQTLTENLPLLFVVIKVISVTTDVNLTQIAISAHTPSSLKTSFLHV